MTAQPEQQTTAREVVAWLYTKGRTELSTRPLPPEGADPDHWTPLVTVAYAEAQVREAEARIVAWLRADRLDEGNWCYGYANAIERGEHR